ncbi:MAG TPA: Nramp family divalent metal transporter [Gaiellaceae bacterium]|jgi:Mn2+/Fe2+ NRAMP family transporter|nr:Nramp family divalent metal transporter [Gaiellaceae bacterium]
MLYSVVKQLRRRHGRPPLGAAVRRLGLPALLAVLGPGLLAGLSDDDPAGITTYSIAGARYGYELLWVLALSVAALVVYHELGARLGLVTGQGLVALVRSSYGPRLAFVVVATLVVANLGTTCAEFAGVAAGLELAGISRYLSVPTAAVLVGFVVLRGSFHRVEHVLLLLSTVFITYVGAAFLAHPDWAAAGRGLVVPQLPLTNEALVIVTGIVGTTLAPWGLAFIQSYAADKRLTQADVRFERIDVVSGAALTGIIGAFVLIACAATLHATGHRDINDARDAAVALKPLAGHLASTLFGAGLVGAALLAAAVVPLSTAYSVAEGFGREARLDDSFAEAPFFYLTYLGILALGAAFVLIPGLPLVPVLFLTQVLNAVLLLPLLVAMRALGRDKRLLGAFANGRGGDLLALFALAVVSLSIAGLAVAGFAR